MKGLVASAVVASAILASSDVVESFAPPSRRIAVVTSTSSVHHDVGTRAATPFNSLFAVNKNSPQEDDKSTNNISGNSSRQSRRSKLLRTIRHKSKPITLAILTSTFTFLPHLSHLLTPPAHASAPIVLRPNKKKDDPPMVQALKKAEKLKKQKSLDEFDAFMAKANDVEVAEGKAARDAYEKQYQMDKEAAEAQKKIEIEKLKRSLLDKGQDPNTDLDAEQQLFQLEHDVDLTKISGTPHNEQMIKNFQRRNKNIPTLEKQRYIVACQVADVKARGIDPLEYFGDKDVMEKTRAMYKMDDKTAERVAAQYEGLMAEYGGRLTPSQGEVPFVYDEGGVTSSAAAGAAVAYASDKEAARAAQAAAKAERAAEKQALKQEKAEERANAKAERLDAKEKLRAERAAAKEQRLAEKLAKKQKKLDANNDASAATATTVASIDDDDIAATANGDVFSTAGTNAVAKSSTDTTDDSTSVGNKVQSMKKYATKRNVGTVVVGGAAAVYGINYYQENSAASVGERERQLKLILGEDDDDDEEDDDEFDDDDEDEYEQFIKKKPAPPKDSKPKSDTDTTKSSTPAPPAVPSPPTPAPKPKPKRLGIFAKRNANARETDINALITPKAQSPTFAKTLAQILTFGAPGRFPDIASWGDMPLDAFDLDPAKEMLTSVRTDEELSDEQSAEIFANVVNCMIIDIVDLASSTLKGKKTEEKVTVDAINVVMDFMDHAASLFDAVAKDVTIKPVTYGGSLRKKDLEQMFSVYAGSSMLSLDGTGTTQDRVDTLQLVFAISDKKAEGLMQKHMMKMMMNLMKDGGKGLENMPGMEGMEGMEEMMQAMGGAGGMGLPGLDGGELSPEDLKQTVGMMKELMDSGQVSEEELAEVRKQFKEMYGSDISDLIKKAGEEGAEGGMTEDESALLEMFKQILGEE